MPKPDAQAQSNFSGLSSQPRGCERPGCPGDGVYPAPKSRDRLREYFWFCLDHVREYNRAWDYYLGMSVNEIEAALRADTTWQRPTWPLGSWRLHEACLRERVNAEPGSPFGRTGGEGPNQDGFGGRGGAKPQHGPLDAEDEAMRVLDLDQGASFAQIKARYRDLAKIHHPDANGGDKAAEEKLKSINQAYTTLKANRAR
ncbi:MAG: J domain-containing protein [Rhodospirillaceae bacterium]